jgi:hypothetical protein
VWPRREVAGHPVEVEQFVDETLVDSKEFSDLGNSPMLLLDRRADAFAKF